MQPLSVTVNYPGGGGRAQTGGAERAIPDFIRYAGIVKACERWSMSKVLLEGNNIAVYINSISLIGAPCYLLFLSSRSFVVNLDFIIFLPEYSMGNELEMLGNFHDFMARRIYGLDLSRERYPELDVCYALIYEAEVNNGGHGQFIVNMDNDSHAFDAALSGLRQIGAVPQMDILSKMIAWVQSNPVEVDKLFHMTKPPPELNEFDECFFVENHVLNSDDKNHILDRNDENVNYAYSKKMTSIARLAGKWLKKHPNVKFVSDEKFIAIRDMK